MKNLVKSLIGLLLTSAILLSCNSSTAVATGTVQLSTKVANTKPVITAGTQTSMGVDIKFECPIVETNLADLKSNGMLILDANETNQTYLMDMKSQNMKQINKPEENLEFFRVSPAHDWMIYTTTIHDELVVAGIDNYPVKLWPLEDDWGGTNWLNDETIIVNLVKTGDAASSDFLLLNAFTNEQHILNADYPDMYRERPLPNWDGWGVTVYSPTVDRVVYLQGGISGPYSYTLWDTQNRKVIAQLPTVGDLFAIPRWSSSGNKFAVALGLFSKAGDYPSYEIFMVTSEGNITQLTHLSDYYPWVYIADLSWSPDSRYIAFWYSYRVENSPTFGSTENRFLGILDLQTGFTTSYCINGELDAEIGVRKLNPPLWSPDSKQIIIQSQVDKESYLNFHTILIDVPEKRAFHIADELEPVGWMISR